jgi:hypothetical protein
LPEGRRLFPDRDIGSLGVVLLDDVTDPNQKVPGISFNRRKAVATPTKGAVSDLWVVSLDGTQQRQVIANRSDKWGLTGAGSSVFAMVDERQVTNAAGSLEAVATLVRIDSHYQPNVRFENISNFTIGDESHLLLRQVPEDGELPGLFLWDGENQRRLADLPSGSFNVSFSGSGAVYFIDNDRGWNRLASPTDTIQALHANVNSFNVGGGERYAVLSLTDSAGTRTVGYDLQSGQDIRLARPNPSSGVLFVPGSDHVITYSRSALGGAPAEYHTMDLTTGIDTTMVLPAPLVDFAGTLGRPGGEEVVYLDSQGHGVVFSQSDHQLLRTVKKLDDATGAPVPALMLSPAFTKDGKYLLYLDPQPLTESQPYPHGPLMIQEADFVDQPVEHPRRRLTTDGMSVRSGAFLFIDGPTTDAGVSQILVFWAGLVRSGEDIYFANYETGDLQVVANSIGNVEVGNNEIFGTVNISAQDLVGDLVVKDVQDSGGRTIAHAVAEAKRWWDSTASLTRVAYVVRGRAPSDHDGLWLTTQDLPTQDGGQ